MYPRKGVHDLISAAVRLKERGIDFSLHITGVIQSQDYFEQVRAAATEGGIADRVAFKGLLSEDDLMREFGEAAVVILPSYAETSPMFIGQAMAAGKAIIATRVGGLPYLIDDGRSGMLVEPGDVDGISDRLARLLADEELRQRFGAQAGAEALARFSPAEVADKTIRVFREVLAERR